MAIGASPLGVNQGIFVSRFHMFDQIAFMLENSLAWGHPTLEVIIFIISSGSLILLVVSHNAVSSEASAGEERLTAVRAHHPVLDMFVLVEVFEVSQQVSLMAEPCCVFAQVAKERFPQTDCR